ncbi:hypothetical protein STCU_10481 [Strigomonas culicis]|uniref:Uncharacterized protein n=1 Tax=Strigomonas culicis TaxID=28005 RepID=S9TMT4_9TRYP|nr:hypothetical protein STCU_10481 [Strigomonas culicis]|eukprot:EPY17663.1 hypothetical protein STCU_10481 [Strigomonas culicis]
MVWFTFDNQAGRTAAGFSPTGDAAPGGATPGGPPPFFLLLFCAKTPGGSFAAGCGAPTVTTSAATGEVRLVPLLSAKWSPPTFVLICSAGRAPGLLLCFVPVALLLLVPLLLSKLARISATFPFGGESTPPRRSGMCGAAAARPALALPLLYLLYLLVLGGEGGRPPPGGSDALCGVWWWW